MAVRPLRIWCNADLPDNAARLLREGVGQHELVLARNRTTSNLTSAAADETMDTADIAFGQPDPDHAARTQRLRWIHLTSAGYTRYDREGFRKALRARGAALTNSSWVYAEPCAQHVLAMILAQARQFPQCWAEQRTDRAWRSADHRIRSRFPNGQTALIYGYGAIAARSVELLAPFKMNLLGVRRRARTTETIPIVSVEEGDRLLPRADHVINILPANETTDRFFDARRFGLLKPGAVFYNIGRGTTADQSALLSALTSGPLAAAYLDVTDPEPLPPDHPLWSASNCFISPHTAGGHDTEFERLVEHFLDNLRRFERDEPLVDRVI